MEKIEKSEIIAVGIMGLFLLLSISSANHVNDTKEIIDLAIENHPLVNINDSIDQQQNKGDDFNYCIHCDQWGAQSFVPSMPTLTRIKLRLLRMGKQDPDYGLTVVIWDKLGGVNLTNITLKPTNVSGPSGGWNEFDVPDIFVEPGQTYYILCGAEENNNNAVYGWIFEEDNPYRLGNLFLTYDQGEHWHPHITQDFCFITYGIPNMPPETPQKPSGPEAGRVKKIYKFTTVASDPDGNKISYGWDWDGDMTVDEWTEYYESGREIECSHFWDENGIYEIRVIAKDEYGLTSDWSDPLITNMPKKYHLSALLPRLQYIRKNWEILLFPRFSILFK